MTQVEERAMHYQNVGDPRVEDWLLMQTPYPAIAIALIYIIICVTMPRVLKGRTIPVYYPVLVYNFLMVALSFWMAAELFVTTRHYNWKCDSVDYSFEEQTVRTANAMWWYFFSKIIEMLDTMFFICKGNYRQLSFLHIYHHSSMATLMWIGAKYVPGGNMVFGAILNCIVHVIMYSYYFLAACGPQLKPYLWWKRYITRFQIFQFVAIGLQQFATMLVGCRYPHWMQQLMSIYMLSYIFLFTNFYIVNYIRKTNQKKSN
jgi:elongation of very long chain fatty acids protein 4